MVVYRVEQELNMNVLFGKFHRCGILSPKLVKFLVISKKIKYYAEFLRKSGVFCS